MISSSQNANADLSRQGLNFIMENSDVIKSYAGSGVTAGAGFAAWFATNMPVFEGISLIISIVAGAVTIVYTLKKIFEKK